MRVVGYMRVSTDHQTNENQRIRIREFCDRRDWDLLEIYEDVESGSKRSRPGLDDLLRDARRGGFVRVVAVRVDRLSRSLQDLIEISGRLSDSAVSVSFCDHDIDISSSMGKAMFQILGVFAELEREMIIERTKAGQRRARRQGKKIGRPKINGATVEKVRRLRSSGMSLREISKETRISIGKISEICKGVHKVVSPDPGLSSVQNEDVHKTEVC